MPYSAAAVANEFLDRASAAGDSLTQINIQKLVYFAQGWNLAWTGQPLILELIEAWTYGPVVRSLYNQFRRFGSARITDQAVDFGVDTFGKLKATPACLADTHSKNVVGAVWQQYGKLAPFKLVELTHAAGSPWEQARRNHDTIISNEAIQRYFRQLAQVPA